MRHGHAARGETFVGISSSGRADYLDLMCVYPKLTCHNQGQRRVDSLPEFRLEGAKLDLKIRRDGTADGFIGGYQPWSDLYFAFASGGQAIEQCIVGDIPGLYYLLKKNADGHPDPTTGVNSTISATYYIEAVPAFAVPASQARYDGIAGN